MEYVRSISFSDHVNEKKFMKRISKKNYTTENVCVAKLKKLLGDSNFP